MATEQYTNKALPSILCIIFLFLGKSFCIHITDAFRANWIAKICHLPTTLKLLYSFSTLRFSHLHSTQLRSSNTRFFCVRRVCLLCVVYSACSISTIQSTQCIFFLFIHSICRWIADSDEAINIIHFGMYFLWLWNWNMKIAAQKRFNRRFCLHLIAAEYWICLCILWFIRFIFCLLNLKWMMKIRVSRKNSHLLDVWLCCVAFWSLIYSVFINSAANKRKMGIHSLNSLQLSSWWIFRMLFLGTKWTEYEYKTHRSKSHYHRHTLLQW